MKELHRWPFGQKLIFHKHSNAAFGRRGSVCFRFLALGLWLVIAARSDAQEAAAPSKYLYVWYARQSDVEGRDAMALGSLLKLVKTEPYAVKKGESLDSITRQLFSVSSSEQPRAYTLYLQRLRELNPNVSDDTIYPGQVLTVPSGPKYSTAQVDSQIASMKEAIFDHMMTSANGSSAAHHTSNDSVLQGRIARQVKPFLFTDNLNSVSDEQAFRVAKEKGLLPSADIVTHPEQRLSQMHLVEIDIAGPAAESTLTTLRTNSSSNAILPYMIPMAKAVASSTCACTKVADLLQMPATATTTGARLLIEDTGVNSQISDNNYIYKGSGNNGTDIDRQRYHGTFVYGEIAASVQGILPDSQVYVAKAAQLSGTDVVFPMPDILNGWEQFGQAMRAGPPGGANTWVVNLSAAGIPATPVTGSEKPVPPFDENELVVAAAGNDGTPDAASNAVFDKLCNGDLNLLIVAALDQTQQQLTTYSNSSPVNVQLAAQGDCVCGPSGVAQIDGTSQASPIVALAASVLAANRHQWMPQDVMWRLLSTADRLPLLKGRVLAGKVNLTRALQTGIVATVRDKHGQIHEILASSVQFSGTLDHQFVGIEAVAPANYILRLYDRTDFPQQSCFTYLRYQLLAESQNLCADPADEVIITEEPGGQIDHVAVTNLIDLVLPIKKERDPSAQFPVVAYKPSP